MFARHIDRHNLAALAEIILKNGKVFRFQAQGGSMQPFIRDGDFLEVWPWDKHHTQVGDILFYKRPGGGVIAHRVVRCRMRQGQETFVMQGDAFLTSDGMIKAEHVLGRLAVIERQGKRIDLDHPWRRWTAKVWANLSPVGQYSMHVSRKMLYFIGLLGL